LIGLRSECRDICDQFENAGKKFTKIVIVSEFYAQKYNIAATNYGADGHFVDYAIGEIELT